MSSFMQQKKGGSSRTKNLVKPVKPLIEGKTLGEAMKGDDSLSSGFSGNVAGFDSDEGSLGSAQNLIHPAPASNENSGILAMFSSFSRLGKNNKQDAFQRVGELPNKSKLQEKVASDPIRPTYLRQNSGTFAFDRSPKTPIQPTRRLTVDAPNSAPSGSSMLPFDPVEKTSPVLDDDDFFAEMDKARPKLDEFPIPEEEKDEPHSKKKASPEKEQEIEGWLPIVAKTAIKKSRPASSIDFSDHSASSLAAKNKPLSKDTMLAQEQARKQQEELAKIMAQTAVTMEDLDDISTHTNGSRASQLKSKLNAGAVVETNEAYALRMLRQFQPSVSSESEEEKEAARPKTKRELELEKVAKKQREQLEAIIQSTPDAEEALETDDIFAKKERKSANRTAAEWHDVNEGAAEDRARRLGLNDESSADSDGDYASETRESRKLKEAERKRMEELRSTLQNTPDAEEALERTKVVSNKDRKKATKTRGSWVEVGKQSAKEQKSTQDFFVSDDDQQVPINKRDRKLEQAARKQRQQVNQRRVDSQDSTIASDPESATDTETGQEFRVRRNAEWHGLQNEQEVAYKDLERKGNYKTSQKLSTRKSESNQRSAKKVERSRNGDRRSVTDSRNSDKPKSNPSPRKRTKSAQSPLVSDAFARQFASHSRGNTSRENNAEFETPSKKTSRSTSNEDVVMEVKQAMVNSPLQNQDAWQGVSTKQHPFERLKKYNATDTGITQPPKQKERLKQSLDTSNHSGDSSMGESHLVDDRTPSIYESSVLARPMQALPALEENERSSSSRKDPMSSEELSNAKARRSTARKENKRERKRSKSRKRSRKTKKNKNFGWERVSTHSQSQNGRPPANTTVRKSSRAQGMNAKDSRKRTESASTNSDVIKPMQSKPSKKQSSAQKTENKDVGDATRITTKYGADDEDLQNVTDPWASVAVARTAQGNHTKYETESGSASTQQSMKKRAVTPNETGLRRDHDDDARIASKYGADNEDMLSAPDNAGSISLSRFGPGKYAMQSKSRQVQPSTPSTEPRDHGDEARIAAKYGADDDDLLNAPDTAAGISVARSLGQRNYDSAESSSKQPKSDKKQSPRPLSEPNVYDDESRIAAKYGADDSDLEVVPGASVGVSVTRYGAGGYGKYEKNIDVEVQTRGKEYNSLNNSRGENERISGSGAVASEWNPLELGATRNIASYYPGEESSGLNQAPDVEQAGGAGGNYGDDEEKISSRYSADGDDLRKAPGTWTGVSLGRTFGNETLRARDPKTNLPSEEEPGPESTQPEQMQVLRVTPSVEENYVEDPSKSKEKTRKDSERLQSQTSDNAQKVPDNEPIEDNAAVLPSDGQGLGPFDARPEITPFAYRPPTAGPFASRPATKSDENTVNSKIPDGTTLASRRKQLRRQVDDRREALTSMLSLTRQSTWSTENELLDLKRKLTISQALVEKLEIENAALGRKAVVDFSEAQLVLLEQRANREQELEERIQVLMNERNSAVLECHELRILITGSCEVCRKRFDNAKEYAMDHSVRNTVLEKRKLGRWAAFEWFTGNLAGETEGGQSLTAEEVASRRGLSMDAIQVASLPGDSSGSKVKPLAEDAISWISDKLNAVVALPMNEGQHNEKLEAQMMDPSQNATGPNPGLLQSDIVPNSTKKGTADSPTNTNENVPRHKFLSGLEAEKVHDEFSTITSHKELQTTASKKSSFFSTLFGERVDEDSTFSMIDPRHAKGTEKKVEKSVKPASSLSLGFGLKSEKVLDDMEILNSLVGDSDAKPSPASKQDKHKSRSFGLGDEEFDDDLRDLRLLSKSRGGKSSSSKSQATKQHSNMFGLRQEKFDDTSHDAQLLDLLKASEHGRRTTEKTANQLSFPSTDTNAGSRNGRKGLWNERFDDEDRDAHLLNLIGTKNSFGESKSPKKGLDEHVSGDDRDAEPLNILQGSDDAKLSPLPSEKPKGGSISQILSPFGENALSPRRMTLTNKGRRGSSAVNYKSKFSPGGGTIAVRSPALAENTESGPIARKQRPSMANHVPVDVEVEGPRPWRNDSGGKLSGFTLPSIEAIDESLHSSGEEDGKEPNRTVRDDDDDLDRFAALLEAEE